jgi:four helix bundle protein
MNKKDLEKRLVDFSASVLNEVQKLENDKATNHLTGQIIRSSSSVALNYGEAQSAESKKDFIHKVSIVLKELRETMINLSIISNLESYKNNQEIMGLIRENDELIAIFYKTIKTARNKSDSTD